MYMNLLYKIVCIVFLSVWGTIYSSAYKVNGIYYRLDTKTGWLYIIKSEDPGGYKGKIEAPITETVAGTKRIVADFDDDAFVNCPQLNDVIITTTDKKITPEMFAGCTSLDSIKVYNGIQGSYNGVLYNFKGKNIDVFPPGREGEYTILNSWNLKGEAFLDCKKLTAINLEYWSDIESGGFKGCDNLTAFNISTISTKLCDIDGVAYDKKKTTIKAFPTGRHGNYTIYEQTGFIGKRAFAYCSLDTLIVPEKVSNIEKDAFTEANIKNLFIEGYPMDYSFLKDLDTSSIVYVHGKDYEKAKKYFSGTIKTYEHFWVKEQIETLLGKVIFSLQNGSSNAISTRTTIVVKNGIYISSVTCNGIAIKKNNNGTYTAEGLVPSNYYPIEIKWNAYEKGKIIDSGTDKDTIKTAKASIKLTYVSKKTNSITLKTTVSSDESLSPSEFGSYCDQTKLQYQANSITGKSEVSNLIPDSTYSIWSYAIYNGKRIIGSTPLRLKTDKPNIDIKIDSTQTTFTINSLKVIADEGTIAPKTIGFIYDGKEYIWNGKTISFKNLYPNRLYVIYPFAIYEKEHKITLNEKYIRTKSFHPSIYKISAGPTSIHVKGTYSLGDSKLEKAFFSDHDGEGDDIVVTGLKPNTKYSFRYWVKASGASEYATLDVTTAKITLESQNPKVLGNNSAIVCAKTNIENEEKGAGFEWRKTDAPDVVVSKSGSGVVYGGMLEGRINNLSTSSYYKVRPFYKASDGTMYYGEWIGFDPSDFSYFEPTVHTYARVSVQSTSAKVKGVALQGTEDITEQGFEYWAEKAIASRAAGDKQIIQATGQSMEAEITDLAPNTTYNYRAYAKTSKGTTYGETLKFTTPVATAIIGITNTTNSDLQFNVRNTNNVQIAINGTDKECNYRMNSITGANVASGKTTADGEWHSITNYQLPSGIYIITVSDGKDKKSTKIAIK